MSKKTKSVSSDSSEKPDRESLNKVHDRLYHCRDIEISNLWQRSIFLSAFLILCFTGYGYILMKVIDASPNDCICNCICNCCNNTCKCYSNSCSCNMDCKLFYLHIIALIVAGISAIFSTLWIMMAKGSKAWYEVYETAITAFENENFEEIGLPKVYIMGEMGIPISELNNCLFSTKAGGYSVSKINILIGQICLCICVIAILFHSICLLSTCCKFIIGAVLLIFIVLIGQGIYYCIHKSKSGFLNGTIFGKKGRDINKK